jgi:mono/diheme cytochrome c family protein
MMRVAMFAFSMMLGVAPVALAQGDAAKGAQLFTDQKCALCHSIAGKGNAKGPLDEVGSKLTAADIRAWITDAQAMTAKTKPARTPAMKQYALPKADVDALVAYLSTLKK